MSAAAWVIVLPAWAASRSGSDPSTMLERCSALNRSVRNSADRVSGSFSRQSVAEIPPPWISAGSTSMARIVLERT